ncbi:RIP metalloprotease RseP [Thermoflavimicrobium daqui]|jgi:regulator of sigma E protease|uniref:Zinc metalloprotease n=1 Tax=Thermoflavimicrobium daqui TaxID=2137476 RepID=A0A364K7P6_9BACL|nr:RIP metalloprotease RseP [Thermoflavimicrobium daqui]RAL26325.1 RIP metalloprotease RseP [Thermoflavimicrobium daqui]
MQTILVFILVLSVLVFFHELGHFLFAKRAGILVREFAIGFGPKIFAKRYGETLYSIRILPLGGYVRMAGEDPEMVEIKTGTLIYAMKNEQDHLDHVYLYDPQTEKPLVVGRVIEIDMEKDCYIILQDEYGEETKYSLDRQAFIHYDPKNQVQIAPLDRQFGSKTVGQKAMAIFAGPLFNILLTIVLFIVLAFQIGIESKLVVDKVLTDTPAARAGIKNKDVITEINGEKATSQVLISEIQESKGNPVQIMIERNGQRHPLKIAPKMENNTYLIGVVPVQHYREPSIIEAISDGFKRTYNWSILILDSFVKLITGEVSVKSLAGPVQMGDMTGKIAKKGVDPLIQWTAVLSLNLAIFNLLPIPALDGSRLIFIGIEAIRGRPIHPNKENLVHLAGFALLMVLMLVVTYNDIMKVFFT